MMLAEPLRSEEHTSELQSRFDLVCRLLLEKKKEKWFLENEKTVTQFCRKLAADRPLKDIRDEYNYPKKKGIKDECARLLEAYKMKSRRGFAMQRLMNAMRQAHADGWLIVVDTLTLADYLFFFNDTAPTDIYTLSLHDALPI